MSDLKLPPDKKEVEIHSSLMKNMDQFPPLTESPRKNIYPDLTNEMDNGNARLRSTSSSNSTPSADVEGVVDLNDEVHNEFDKASTSNAVNAEDAKPQTPEATEGPEANKATPAWSGGAYSRAANRVKEDDTVWVTGRLKGIPNDEDARFSMSEIELARLLVNGLGIAPADIKAVDTSKHKILRIGFFKGVNTDKYLNSSAVKIREDLRLQPMRSTAREVEVEVQWTAPDTDDNSIKEMVGLFGKVLSIQHATFDSKEKNGQINQLLASLSHVKKGMRKVKLILERPIPMYCLLEGFGRCRVWYEGIKHQCARCLRPAFGRDRCRAKANANDCEHVYKTPRRSIEEFWETEILNNAEIHYNISSHFFATDRVEISNLDPDVTNEEVVELVQEMAGLEINLEDVEETAFPTRRMVKNLSNTEIGLTISKLDKVTFKNKTLACQGVTHNTPKKPKSTEEIEEERRLAAIRKRREDARQKDLEREREWEEKQNKKREDAERRHKEKEDLLLKKVLEDKKRAEELEALEKQKQADKEAEELAEREEKMREEAEERENKRLFEEEQEKKRVALHQKLLLQQAEDKKQQQKLKDQAMSDSVIKSVQARTAELELIEKMERDEKERKRLKDEQAKKEKADKEAKRKEAADMKKKEAEEKKKNQEAKRLEKEAEKARLQKEKKQKLGMGGDNNKEDKNKKQTNIKSFIAGQVKNVNEEVTLDENCEFDEKDLIETPGKEEKSFIFPSNLFSDIYHGMTRKQRRKAKRKVDEAGLSPPTASVDDKKMKDGTGSRTSNQQSRNSKKKSSPKKKHNNF